MLGLRIETESYRTCITPCVQLQFSGTRRPVMELCVTTSGTAAPGAAMRPRRGPKDRGADRQAPGGQSEMGNFTVRNGRHDARNAGIRWRASR